MEPIKQYLYKRSLLKQQKANVRSNIEVQKAKQIGILFNASQLDSRDKVVRFGKKLNESGYHVKILGYVDQKIESISFQFDYFTPKDVNFYYVPKNDHIDHFLGFQFDIVMNLDLSNRLPIHYLAAAANAGFKVGPPSAGQDHYHLMIESNEKNQLEGFIREMRNTLNKIA